MEIPLTRGYRAVVDDEDSHIVLKHKWCAALKDRQICAITMTSRNPGPRKRLYLHRVLLGITDPTIMVDHIDRDSLNNRRSNLRIATHAENMRNARKHLRP